MTEQLTRKTALAVTHRELAEHLEALIEFWSTRALDLEHGGYRTCFDGDSRPDPTENQAYLVSQARLVWTFANLAEHSSDLARRDWLLAAARHGVDYLRERFLDRQHGGWFWKVDKLTGAPLDPAKLVYGQSFAIYALAAFARISGDQQAREEAVATFDLLQVHGCDVRHGGYFENFEQDWVPCVGTFSGANRKSLDIHLHLLECYTELARVTRHPTHLRRLGEVRSLLLDRMLLAQGAGGHQYEADWRPLDPIVIDRTWLAERLSQVDRGPFPTTTSYGHNLELGWLLLRADAVLGLPEAADAAVLARIGEHTLAYGYDNAHGGVFREGPPVGPASDRDKEFWQNAEALTGFLEIYRSSGDERYLQAFLATWAFVRDHLISPHGEWRTRTTADGRVLDHNLGNYWTGAYHTVRGVLEPLRLLDSLSTPSPTGPASFGGPQV